MPISAARNVNARLQTTGASPTLRQGSSGASVTELQSLLQRAGFSPGSVDGDFGPKTLAAVKRFQVSKGLAMDGVVGPKTWAALRGSATTTPPATSAATPTLRNGDFGADVQKAQELLKKHGYSPGTIDGQFGPKTRSAVVQFQRAKGLEADGVIGAATWRALNGTVSSTPVTPTNPGTDAQFRQRLLDVARGELGKVETGSNRGEILKYPNAFGRGSEAWCADFTSWVSKQSGGKMNNPWTPGVVAELKRSGDWKGKSNPQPGDLVLFDWDGDGGADHIGLVEKVNADGSIGTIEGNTENPQTGVEGVWRRTRTMGTILGFGNPY